MPHKKSERFDTIQKMVRDHLADAEKFLGTSAENPGPKPHQCYTAAFGTATGAYAGRGIDHNEWAALHKEIRDHQAAWT